ncbi:hypothetical protein COBT_003465 [Conglomerata obtusa]
MCVYDTWNDFDNEALSSIFKLPKTYVTKIRCKLIIKNCNKKNLDTYVYPLNQLIQIKKTKGIKKTMSYFFGYCYNKSAKIVYQNVSRYIDGNISSRKKLNDALTILHSTHINHEKFKKCVKHFENVMYFNPFGPEPRNSMAEDYRRVSIDN